MPVGPKLPSGAGLFPLKAHRDDRGSFTEVFRRSWETGVDPVQWNVVESEEGVLRGVHAHVRHDDYLLLVSGAAQIGLKDLRLSSPTEGHACVVELSGDERQALHIPRGVAHGFYFTAPSVHLYSVTHYWNLDDEFGCRWDDPELGIPWSPVDPLVSRRDETAGPLREMMRALEPHQPFEAVS